MDRGSVDNDRSLPTDISGHGNQNVIVDDLLVLAEILPNRVSDWIRQQQNSNELLELVLDLGRPIHARFLDHEVEIGGPEVTEDELDSVACRIGVFGDDNRAGIERTLHRISCIRNRSGKIVGLTCRVGRAVFGTIRIIEDLFSSGQSVLLLGRPGVGKTTMLREVARVMADNARKRVVVVDTSNEIAGDGDIPHSAIGRARRMHVRTPSLQHAVMIEAVENHMPEVIVIDEMGTELEAAAARTIAERGVQLIGTAHGNTLDNLIMNPTLADLVGGIQNVTLGDEEARRRSSQKSILERKGPPTFQVVVEIQSWDRVTVHSNVARTIDSLLRGYSVTPEFRHLDDDGVVVQGVGDPMVLHSVMALTDNWLPPEYPRQRPVGGRFDRKTGTSRNRKESDATTMMLEQKNNGVMVKHSKVYPFGINKDSLLDIARYYGIDAGLATRVEDADMVLTTKTHYKRKSEPLRAAREHGVPIHVLRKNTPVQMEQFLKSLSSSWGNGHQRDLESALEEAEIAVEQVTDGEVSVELRPQSSYIRRLQHQLAEQYNLSSASMGREPSRRVIIFRP